MSERANAGSHRTAVATTSRRGSVVGRGVYYSKKAA